MTRPDFVLVTGHQRTGTSVFRALLVGTGRFFDCGEILTIERARTSDPLSFFTFLKETGADLLQQLIPAHEEVWRRLDAYLRFLKERAGDRTVVLDVKYDFLHLFAPESWLFTRRPLLLEFCAERNVPVLNFVRRNLLDQYLSLQYALAAGQWHYTRDDAEVQKRTFTVDPVKGLEWLQSTDLASRIVQHWLSGMPQAVNLVYEDLYDGDVLSASVGASLERLLGVKDVCGRPLPYVKTPVRYWEQLANREELRRHLEGSAFADLLGCSGLAFRSEPNPL